MTDLHRHEMNWVDNNKSTKTEFKNKKICTSIIKIICVYRGGGRRNLNQVWWATKLKSTL
jgi:hypothetical protein